MIYLISEDNFFAMGILSILEHANMDAHCITPNTFGRIITNVDENDIILLCAQSQENSRTLARLARCTVGKILFFIEDNMKKSTFENLRNGVISKKCNAEDLVSAIDCLSSQFINRQPLLSHRETTVMNMLAKQYDGIRIARLLKLSVKTVSGHKHNALRKLGLDHLNARSVLLYERVFQSRV